LFVENCICVLLTLVIIPLSPASGIAMLGRPPVHVAVADAPVSNVHTPTNGVATSELPLLPHAPAARESASANARTEERNFRVVICRMGGPLGQWGRMLQRNQLICWAMPCAPRFSVLVLAAAALSGAGCTTIFVSLPTTPALQALSEEQVFAM